MNVALDYKPEGSVLSFGQPPASALHRMTLTWPAFAWRIMAPAPRNNPYDPLQMMVLKLIRAGCSDAVRIAFLTGIDHKLIKNILAGLQVDDLIDKNVKLTTDGESLLRADVEADELTSDSQMGWMFTCRISGDVLPCFHIGELPFARHYQLKDIVSHLPPGSAYVRPPKPPEPTPVLESIRRYRQLFKLTEMMVASEQAEYDYTVDIEDTENWRHSEEENEHSHMGADITNLMNINRVLILPSEPEPVALIFQMFAEQSSPGEPFVQSPFGMAGGFRFRKVLERYAREREDVEWIWSEFRTDAIRLFNDRNRDKTDAVTITSMAEHQVELSLGASIKDYDDRLHKDLVRMETDMIHLHNGFEQYDSLVSRGQKVLERLFNEMIKSLQLRRHTIRRLPEDVETRIRVIDQDGTSLGAATVPVCFGTPRPGAVSHAATGNGKVSLAPRITALILHAAGSRSPEHPMFRMIQLDPDLLRKIADVCEARNTESHASDEQVQSLYGKEQILELSAAFIAKVYHIIRLALFNIFNLAEEQHGEESR
ncbi:hypothetical protein ACFPES_31080 [Paenibacillus sp. GCM10023248]|uniref:hypothetical protein n=1 Tax=unclassified Paenibacillus TaxID=185978 RepID=UPI0023784B70|nr:hypothetical protein [Paenibacillus sp. MAHUQ-63]MDD9271488.1 hypothetical protein [Paenibacillus sp. MAHUQ-63]